MTKPRPEPLPFRLGVPGSDTVGFGGAQSISYRMEGLFHLVDRTLTLEWTGTRRTQKVSLGGVKDEVDHFPVEWLDIPLSWVRDVRLRGGWWLPRLEIRARRLDAFLDAPAGRGGAITLRIRRRDREVARAMVRAIDLALAAAELLPEYGEGQTEMLSDGS